MSESTRRRGYELKASQLQRRLDPRMLSFRTTEDVEPLVGESEDYDAYADQPDVVAHLGEVQEDVLQISPT